MRNIKKLLSIAMVLAMVLSLGASAFAATVNLPDEAMGHTMVAYQIFKGEQLNPGNNAQLGITGWGDGVDSAALLNLLSAYSDKFKPDMDFKDVAKVLNEFVGNDAQARVALANVIAKAVKGDGVTFENGTADLPNGYWVVIDRTPDAELAKEGAASRSTVILEVVGANLTLQDKIDKPTVEKKVDGQDSVVAQGPKGETVGSILTFTLTTHLPENYADFQKYVLKFKDDMGPGLTPYTDETHVATIKYGSYAAETILLEWTDGSTYGGKTFTYTSPELKSDTYKELIAGSEVVLTYYAQLNENAVVRNFNDVTLYYPNDPNWTGNGEDEPPTTPTPPDTVVVFTFKMNGNKVDGAGNALDGAQFTLYKSNTVDGPYTKYGETVTPVWDQESGQFKFGFQQLGEGYYKLEETVVPNGFNRCDDITFQVKVEYFTEADVIPPHVVGDVKSVSVVTEGNDGAEVTFGGFEFDIDDPGDGEGEGNIDLTVINRSGLALPETGGIGTTIFYVVGAILVVGAVILLVSRKRAGSAQK